MDNNSMLNQQIFKAKQNLSSEQLMMVDNYVKSNGSSAVTAWLLLVFLGAFGAHRFYLKKPRAIIFLALTIASIVSLFIGSMYEQQQNSVSSYLQGTDYTGVVNLFSNITGFLWVVIFVLCVIDAFFINKMVNENNIKTTYEAIPLVTGKSISELFGSNNGNVNQSNSFNNQQTNFKFDPNTGQPINNEPKQNNFKFDPNTGQPINNDQNNTTDGDYTNFSGPKE